MSVGAAMAGGNPRFGRQDDDWYPTPANVTEGLFNVWQPSSDAVWEPACGDGSMAKVIIKHAGRKVIASDLYDRGYGTAGVDFLKTSVKYADCIITNPPFDLAAQFIEHAFALGVTELALVLKSTYWHAAKRRALWLEHQPQLICPLLWRPDFLNLGAPTMEVMWCVWTAEWSPTRYLPIERPKVRS